jgi:glycosyltransferase involved in cell wall biosynthesis
MWELARLQRQRGHAVQIFSIGHADSDEIIDGVLVSRVQLAASSRFKAFTFLRKCSERVRSGSAILHFHSMPEAAWVFRKAENPKLLNFDFPRFRRGRQTPLFFFYRQCLTQFDLLMPVSSFCKRTAARYWVLPDKLFRVTFNGVNLDHFQPNPLARTQFREAHGLADCTVLLYAGRVNEQKGTDILIDSYCALRDEFPRLRLVVCGPPGQFGRTGETDLTRRIVQVGGLFLGAVSESELVGAFNAADIFVLPTRQDEMFGMVAAEAQACGIPVVASDNGGLPEVVARTSGALFRAGSVASLTQVLAGLLKDPRRLDDYRQRARENAGRFSWQIICDDLEVAYALAQQRRLQRLQGRNGSHEP